MGDEQRKEKKKLTDSLGLVRDQKIKEDTFGIYYQIMATNRRFFFGLKCKIDCLTFSFFFFHISFQLFKFQIYSIKIFSLTFINFFKKKSGKIFLIIN